MKVYSPKILQKKSEWFKHFLYEIAILSPANTTFCEHLLISVLSQKLELAERNDGYILIQWIKCT